MNIPTCRYTDESQLMYDLFDHFGALPWIKVWRNQVGGAKIGDTFVKFGVRGSGDIFGMVTCAPAGMTARFISIEAGIDGKKQKQSRKHLQEQADWRAFVHSMDGIALLAMQVADVYAELRRNGVPQEWLDAAYTRWAGLPRRDWWV